MIDPFLPLDARAFGSILEIEQISRIEITIHDRA